MNQFDLVKIVFIGNSAVGKSCIILKYHDDTFKTSPLSTIGIDFKVKLLKIEGKNVKLQLWDTAGQEKYRTITTAYYRGADGIVIIFDVADTKSFESVETWMEQVREHALPKVHCVLLGNKIDSSRRVVTTEQGMEKANEFGIPYYDVSAKTGHNITEAIEDSIKCIIQKDGPSKSTSGLEAIQLDSRSSEYTEFSQPRNEWRRGNVWRKCCTS